MEEALAIEGIEMTPEEYWQFILDKLKARAKTVGGVMEIVRSSP